MDSVKLQENIRLLVREVSDMAGGAAGQSATAVAASAFSVGASAASNPDAKRKGAFTLHKRTTQLSVASAHADLILLI